MMDDLRIRRLRALRAALDSPFFQEAVAELRREMADQIADEMDPEKAAAMRSVRIALTRVHGRIESYLNDLKFTEKRTEKNANV